MQPAPRFVTWKDSIAPSVAAALTVPSVTTGMKSVVKNLVAFEAEIVYIYFKTYPPVVNNEVLSEVGSDPLNAAAAVNSPGGMLLITL